MRLWYRCGSPVLAYGDYAAAMADKGISEIGRIWHGSIARVTASGEAVEDQPMTQRDQWAGPKALLAPFNFTFSMLPPVF